MNQKQSQRLGSAIASTILCCAALSLAATDKAQAAVLTYNFDTGLFNGYFKINKISQSKLDELAASAAADPFFNGNIGQPIIEGKLFYKQTTYNYDMRTTIEGDPTINSTFQNLAGEKTSSGLTGDYVSYYYGHFSQNQLHFDGLISRGSNRQSWVNRVLPSDDYAGHIDEISVGLSWSTRSSVFGSTVTSYLGRSLIRNGVRDVLLDRYQPPREDSISYKLVSEDDFAQPVPEPITFAGTALAMAGLSWLKHKKKMEVSRVGSLISKPTNLQI